METAVRLLDEALGTPYAALSEIRETASWGFDGPDFLNAVVRYTLVWKGSPESHGLELLSLCKRIEREMGRTEAPEVDAAGVRRYRNRPIDIDLLFYGTERIRVPGLTVPHPLIGRRPFVLEPLADVLEPDIRSAFPEIFSAPDPTSAGNEAEK